MSLTTKPDTPDLEEQKLREIFSEFLAYLPYSEDSSIEAEAEANAKKAIIALLHQHHNALLRELEGKVEAAKINGFYTQSIGIGVKHVTGGFVPMSDFKQILADARVGEEK